MHLSVILRKNNGQGNAIADIVFVYSSRVCLTTLCTAGIKGCVSAKMPCMFRDLDIVGKLTPLPPFQDISFSFFLVGILAFPSLLFTELFLPRKSNL